LLDRCGVTRHRVADEILSDAKPDRDGRAWQRMKGGRLDPKIVRLNAAGEQQRGRGQSHAPHGAMAGKSRKPDEQ